MSSPRLVPPSSTSWRWQCHKCRTWYVLSCTRRCLHCSHIFCQKTHHSSTEAQLSSPHLHRQTRTRQRSKKLGPCSSEFDFEGWAAWGSWRRMAIIRRNARRQMEKAAYMTWKPKEYYRGGAKSTALWLPRSTETQLETLQRKEEMYLRGEHDCSLHCDYPNECGHTLYAAKEREAVEAGSPDVVSPVGTDDQQP
ncbi:hypothetical protein BR93DRAFT_921298 [Coniochaeta sp. PMI_546]|nr:hypothetical protein BR93DRAFT_921298 [Coniochaeta sp. PMI_546]